MIIVEKKTTMSVILDLKRLVWSKHKRRRIFESKFFYFTSIVDYLDYKNSIGVFKNLKSIKICI